MEVLQRTPPPVQILCQCDTTEISGKIFGTLVEIHELWSWLVFCYCITVRTFRFIVDVGTTVTLQRNQENWMRIN